MESEWRWNRYSWPWHQEYMGLAAYLQDRPDLVETQDVQVYVGWRELWQTFDGGQTWRIASWWNNPDGTPFPSERWGPVEPDHP